MARPMINNGTDDMRSRMAVVGPAPRTAMKAKAARGMGLADVAGMHHKPRAGKRMKAPKAPVAY